MCAKLPRDSRSISTRNHHTVMADAGSAATAPPIRTILATDCGSTTTKAILIEKQGEEYRLTVRGEAPTTVEAPFDDVTVGVLNAVREVEELSGRRLIGEDAKIILGTTSDQSS